MRIKRKMLKATCLVMAVAVVEVVEEAEVEAEATTDTMDTTDIAERKKTVRMMMMNATLHAQPYPLKSILSPA